MILSSHANVRAVALAILLAASLLGFPRLSATAETAPASPVRLWFGGDVHFATNPHNPLLPLRAVTKESIGIINLEGPVHEPADTVYGKKVLRLYNAPRSLGYFESVNVKVATIANNHQDDAGAAGEELTERSLRDAEILPVGGSSASGIYHAGPYRLVFASYVLPGKVPQGLAEELARLRGAGDMLIVSFHVTGKPGYLPDDYQREAVDMAVRAKASVVVCHGRHAVGPVERRDGAIIAWGLGNLAFNCRCTDETDSIILSVTIEPARDGRLNAAACVIPVDAGMLGRASRPAADAAAVFDLLEALGSSRLTRQRGRACF